MEVSSQLHSWIIYLEAYDQFTYRYEAGSAQQQISATSRKKNSNNFLLIQPSHYIY